MSTRLAKQLIYGTLYIVIVVLVFAAIYFIFVRPITVATTPSTCSASTCAPTNTTAIAAGTVLTFVTSPGHYTFLAQVANQNTDFGAQSLNYEIDLEDSSGTVRQSIPGESFIYPSQTKYLAALNVTVTSPFDHAVLVVKNVSWLSSSSIGANPGVAPGQFALQNIQTSVASTTVSVGGQLINTSVVTYSQVVIMAIFGQSNSPVGVSETELSNVAAGANTNFSVIYPTVPNLDPTANQIIVYALR